MVYSNFRHSLHSWNFISIWLEKKEENRINYIKTQNPFFKAPQKL
jgi:hypothetical protein